MIWACMLAYVTGMVNQELLRNEYLAASRDWTAVVQKMVLALNANRMMKIGKRADLEITTERAGDRQSIWFDDPATPETVLSVSICEDAFPISASARVPNSTTNQKRSAH